MSNEPLPGQLTVAALREALVNEQPNALVALSRDGLIVRLALHSDNDGHPVFKLVEDD
jgi:hypothetical protein